MTINEYMDNFDDRSKREKIDTKTIHDALKKYYERPLKADISGYNAIAKAHMVFYKFAEEYIKAEKNPIVRKPVSYALYQTWKHFDGIEKERKETNEV